MVGESLSIVMPVFNERTHLPATIDALVAALEGSGFDAEFVLVDDGSTDGSAEVARASVDGRTRLRVVAQPNRGRFENFLIVISSVTFNPKRKSSGTAAAILSR